MGDRGGRPSGPNHDVIVEFCLPATPPDCGDTDACRIPITVREMTGRGGSFNFDPSFFLDKGRTGLVEVDRWLASVNPSGLAERASVM